MLHQICVFDAAKTHREEAGIAAGERIWKRGKVCTDDLVEGRVMTSGKTSGSFTSSTLTVRFCFGLASSLPLKKIDGLAVRACHAIPLLVVCSIM